MILILLGTQDNSFHRLLDKVQELIDKKVITEKVIVQAGRTKYESKDMEIYSLMPEEKLGRAVAVDDEADEVNEGARNEKANRVNCNASMLRNLRRKTSCGVLSEGALKVNGSEKNSGLSRIL